MNYLIIIFNELILNDILYHKNGFDWWFFKIYDLGHGAPCP